MLGLSDRTDGDLVHAVTIVGSYDTDFDGIVDRVSVVSAVGKAEDMPLDGNAVGCSKTLGEAVKRVVEGNVVGKAEGEMDGFWVVDAKVGDAVGGSEVN